MWHKIEINGFAGYRANAKVFDEGSTYGINEGRISKLEIFNGKTRVYNYDRGLDFDELDATGKAFYSEILQLFA